MKEQVNHPDHYNDYPIEVTDMMEKIWGKEKVRDFCLMNAFKYRMRAGLKDNPTIDFNKEAWYLDKARELGLGINPNYLDNIQQLNKAPERPLTEEEVKGNTKDMVKVLFDRIAYTIKESDPGSIISIPLGKNIEAAIIDGLRDMLKGSGYTLDFTHFDPYFPTTDPDGTVFIKLTPKIK